VTVLNLGVIDIPYAYEQEKLTKKGKPYKKKRKVVLSITTGEVARYLEDEYHIMEVFAEIYMDRIVGALVDAVTGDLDNVLNGRQPNPEVFAPAAAEIETWFKRFLSTREIETAGVTGEAGGANHGIPTQAALDGVNHRLAHPYANTNPRRPSFIDTGLYQSSVKVWITP
jgi:hypothetical protein